MRARRSIAREERKSGTAPEGNPQRKAVAGAAQDPETTWQLILRYGRARRAFEKLRRKGMIAELLRELLLEMPLVPSVKGLPSRYIGFPKPRSEKFPRARDRRRSIARAQKRLSSGQYDWREREILLERAEDEGRWPLTRSYPAELELSEATKRCTGRWFDDDVADLLTAAYQVRGLDRVVGAEALIVNRQRNSLGCRDAPRRRSPMRKSERRRTRRPPE